MQNEFKGHGIGGVRARDTLLSKGIRRATGEMKRTKGNGELNKSANLQICASGPTAEQLGDGKRENALVKKLCESLTCLKKNTAHSK